MHLDVLKKIYKYTLSKRYFAETHLSIYLVLYLDILNVLIVPVGLVGTGF